MQGSHAIGAARRDGQLTYMSIQAIVEDAIARNILYKYYHSKNPAHMARRVYLTKYALSWCLPARKVSEDILAKVAHYPGYKKFAVRLDQFTAGREIETTDDPDYDAPLKRLQRPFGLDIDECWEVRTENPDAARMFGAFLAPNELILTHGAKRADLEGAAWRDNIRTADTMIRALLGHDIRLYHHMLTEKYVELA